MVACRRIAKFKKLIAPMTVEVSEEERGVRIGVRWDDPAVEIPPLMAATELVYMMRIVRLGTREHVVPLEVRSAVALEPRQAYADYFGVTPSAGAFHSVLFSSEDAERPFLTASESLWRVFEPDLQRRLALLDATAPLVDRVRAVLLEGLPAGQTSIQSTARRLGMSPRTLQRKLRSEDAAYKAVVNETRERLARHYLTRTDLGYSEITYLVGFDEPSSFFKAFRDWTGSTPGSVRTEAGVLGGRPQA